MTMSPCKICMRGVPDLAHLANNDMMVCAKHYAEAEARVSSPPTKSELWAEIEKLKGQLRSKEIK